jgi:hypothetical protein
VKPRSIIAHCLLALLLLLSQQLAAMHAVSHIADARAHSSQEKQLPVDQACAQCLAFAQIGSALTGHAFVFADNSIDDAVRIAAPHQRVRAESFNAFRSRAPPALA